MNQDFTGPHILVTKNGGFYAVENLQAKESWVSAVSSNMEITFHISELKNILKVKRTTDLQETKQINQITAGILWVEDQVRKYSEIFTAQNLEIIIFGSTSLALTAIPNSITQDMDMVTDPPFIQFLETQQKKTNLDLEFLPPKLLFALGDWKRRANTLTGYNGTTFQLLHPLDTLVQKLLRLNWEKFIGKDWPDITETMRIFQPSRKTLTDLLTENPFRYNLTGKTAASAFEKNTKKFLKTYMPGISFKKLADIASDTYEATLRNAGLAPLPDINMTKKNPLEKIDHDLHDL
jgi:hypothetical protein